MANILTPDGDARETLELQNQYSKNMNAYNRLDSKTPYDGTLDKFSDVRLRLAVVDNPEIKRNKYDKIDPLNTKGIVNHNTGNITLRWLDSPGGIIRPQETGGDWKYNEKKDKYDPDEREFDEWSITSRREQVQLGHPFIWSNDSNWCGFNYIPPVGSVVVVGFRKQGMPIILGYMPTHYKICYPVLKPGEMTMKGYGNNYTHWRWSDKLDMKVWCKEGELDLDDSKKQKKNAASCTLWIKLNANDRHIEISAIESTSGSINDHNYNKYPTPYNPKDARGSKIIIKPSSILMETGATTYYQQNKTVTVTTKEFTVNAENIHMNATNNVNTIAGNNITDNAANNIAMMAGANTTITSISNTTINSNNLFTRTGNLTDITSGGIVDINGSRINLN